MGQIWVKQFYRSVSHSKPLNDVYTALNTTVQVSIAPILFVAPTQIFMEFEQVFAGAKSVSTHARAIKAISLAVL